ncbi:MAG: prepilin-type N-terminal cleavage/methylation domain-containing protein [Acidobacteriota bacterium]
MATTSSQKGFSLIESLIALSILAVTMLGVVQLFGFAIQQNSFSRYNTMAISVAQQKLEFLQTEFNRELANDITITDLDAGTHSPQTVTLTQPSGIGNYQFRVGWLVVDSGPSKWVKVTVTPVVANEFQTKTLAMTAIFSP